MRTKKIIGVFIVATICLAVGTQAAAEPKMYWTDFGPSTIQRANLDGSGVEDLVTSFSIRGPALDVAGGKMYWINADTLKIRRANLDGSDAEDLVVSPTGQFLNTVGIALDVTGGTMYWTVVGTGIRRVNLDGSGAEDLVTGLGIPFGIALDVAGGKMYWTRSGATVTIQQANLDGSGVEDLVVPPTGQFSSAVGIALDVTGGKMYWTVVGTVTIRRANLDGSGVEDLVMPPTGQFSNAFGIALDVAGGKMYWTDNGTNTIQRANLDGSGVEDLVTTGLEDPRDIALALEDLGGGAGAPGGGGASDITWDVTGVDLDLVVCKNKTNSQKARVDVGVPLSGSCADLGLVWDSGNNIQIKIVGTVTDPADAGGSVAGIAPNLLVCKNKLTGEKVRVDNPSSPWNCRDAGLPLAMGERLQWKAKGPATSFTLVSSAFADNAVIPLLHACTRQGGKDVSPALMWNSPPDGTAAFALIVDDEVQPCGLGDRACRHWQVYNIPADVSMFEEGQAVTDIAGVTQGVNWNQTSNYAGPCPPNEHIYTFTVYALSGSVPSIDGGTALTRSQFQDRFEDHILGSASLRGSFSP